MKKQDKGISDDLKKAVEAYNVNKNKRNAAKVEKALAKIDINIEILSEETINSAIEEIIGLTREYYGLSEEEAKQQINLIKAYAHRKKHGGQSNVAEYMSADNLDAGKQKNNHPELIMEMAEIDDEYGGDTGSVTQCGRPVDRRGQGRRPVHGGACRKQLGADPSRRRPETARARRGRRDTHRG